MVPRAQVAAATTTTLVDYKFVLPMTPSRNRRSATIVLPLAPLKSPPMLPPNRILPKHGGFLVFQ